jgi:hypothetical protein
MADATRVLPGNRHDEPSSPSPATILSCNLGYTPGGSLLESRPGSILESAEGVHIDRYSSNWSHTASPKARKKFVAFLSQIPPRGPFWPVDPVYNYCAVNNMRFVAFLDTEEVAGSNPVVPTIFISNLQ